MSSKSLVLVFTLVLVLSGCFDSSPPLISRKVKDHAILEVNNREHPGLVLAAFDASREEFFYLGTTKLDGSIKVDENTVYAAGGGVTKSFTAILLADMLLKEELHLDDPIRLYLPDTLNVPSRNGKEITLRHLVGHSSGLPRRPDNYKVVDRQNPYAHYTTRMFYEFLHDYELKRDPGEEIDYTHFGTGLLGIIIERHTGKSYAALVKERITSKLGMTSTFVGRPPESSGLKIALAHLEDNVVPDWEFGDLKATGAIWSTASDMVKFMKAHMGLLDSELDEAIRLTLKPVVKADKDGDERMMAWFPANFGDIVYHNGWTGGNRFWAGFHKHTGVGALVLSNTTDGTNGFGFHLLDETRSLGTPQNWNFETVDLPLETFQKYIGDYRGGKGFSISLENEQLYYKRKDTERLPLTAISDREFYVKGKRIKVTFELDSDGYIEKIKCLLGPNTHYYRKIRTR